MVKWAFYIEQSYDPALINLFGKALVKIQSVFTEFKSNFTGKCSPVHLFWGRFELGVTCFSGREAPLRENVIPYEIVRKSTNWKKC